MHSDGLYEHGLPELVMRDIPSFVADEARSLMASVGDFMLDGHLPKPRDVVLIRPVFASSTQSRLVEKKSWVASIFGVLKMLNKKTQSTYASRGTGNRVQGGAMIRKLEAYVDPYYLADVNATLQANRRARLTAKQERQLFMRIREGDAGARTELVECNLPRVILIAKKFRHRGVPLDELIEEGNLALLRAVDGYSLERGIPFGRYATACIRQAMCNLLSERFKYVGISRLSVAEHWKCQQIIEREYARTNRILPLEKAMQIAKLKKTRRAKLRVIEMLTSRSGKDGASCLSDPSEIADSGEDPSEKAATADDLQAVQKAIADASIPEAYVRRVCQQYVKKHAISPSAKKPSQRRVRTEDGRMPSYLWRLEDKLSILRCKRTLA